MSSPETTTTPATRFVDGIELPEPGTFVLDASHSTVGFVARHLMVSKVRGRFGAVEGTLDLAEIPVESSVSVAIDASSVSTDDEGRDAHLRSADFFGAADHPSITFESTAVRNLGEGRLELEGELTIRGVARPVTLSGQIDGVALDPWGSQRIAVSASTEVDREAWGLTWNQALETGGVLVSKKVVLEVDAQFVRQG
jgi:polyisoprenoid-binding protein YceI